MGVGETIRLAWPEDAPQVSYLMYLSGPNTAEGFFGGPGSNAIRVLKELFPIPDHLLSYTHTIVAEKEGKVVGFLLGFDKKAWNEARRVMYRRIGSRFFKIIRPWHIPRMALAMWIWSTVLRESPFSDGDYYIMMLAVLPEARRQGVATGLMRFAEDRARAKGLKRIVLEVLVENEIARLFYDKLGFRTIKTITDRRLCKYFKTKGVIFMAKGIVP